MSREMPRFHFDGVSLERIHAWMRTGDGTASIGEAVVAVDHLARELQGSQDRLRAALQQIGVGWEGAAGAGAFDATGKSERWSVEATPVVHDAANATTDLGGGFTETQSRMPGPGELELNEQERAISSLPIAGPILDQRMRDQKRQQVTREAQDRMNQWQEQAMGAVSRIQPLPEVPAPAVEVQAPEPAPMAPVSDPGQTAPAGVGPSAPAPAAPPAPPPVAAGPGASIPPPVPGPGSGPAVPGGPAPTPTGPGAPPAAGPAPAPPPAGQVPAPRSAVPLVPPPVGAGGGQPAGGRRGAWGPGAFSRGEVAASHGPAGTGQAGRGPVVGTSGPAAAAAGDQRGAGGARAGAGAGQRGGIMQPAVGRADGDQDAEHTDKYADKTDEHFTEGIDRVAPPVIGG